MTETAESPAQQKVQEDREPTPVEVFRSAAPIADQIEVRVTGYELRLNDRVVGTISLEEDEVGSENWELDIPTWDQRRVHGRFQEHTVALHAARDIILQQLEMVDVLDRAKSHALDQTLAIE